MACTNTAHAECYRKHKHSRPAHTEHYRKHTHTKTNTHTPHSDRWLAQTLHTLNATENTNTAGQHTLNTIENTQRETHICHIWLVHHTQNIT